VALHLAGAPEPTGAHLENVVLHDLLAWRDAGLERAELGYWRTAIGEEVDFVIETGGRLLPIEVKATARPRLADAAHLRTFRTEYGKKARAGLLCTRAPCWSGSRLACWRRHGGGSCEAAVTSPRP
jgi:predicted AAA+ superfamily ATPase